MKNKSKYLWNNLLSYFQNNTKFDSDGSIAYQMLIHFEELSEMKIEELAKHSNVTPGTISKFCKKLSFSGFSELKDSVSVAEDSNIKLIGVLEDADPLEKLNQYDSFLTTNIFETLDKSKVLDNLLKSITADKQLLIISPNYSYNASSTFAGIMKSYNIKCIKVSRKSDSDFLKQAAADSDIVLILSITGEWLKDEFELVKELQKLSQLHVVSTFPNNFNSAFSDCVISIGEKRLVLDSHYSSNKSFEIFFLYLATRFLAS